MDEYLSSPPNCRARHSNSRRAIFAAIACAVVSLGETETTYGTESPKRPNIIFMLADDQGWNGLSVAMHPDLPSSVGDQVETPNLERLAAQGMRFSAAYAPAPVCSPTRASLLTGKNPARLHWTKAAPPEEGHKLREPRLTKRISDQETTVAELLHVAGYATAHYGKWHLGSGGPGAHGYDEHDGDTGNEHAFQFRDPNPVDIFGMAERADKFMARNSAAGKPFFIQLSWNALHASENARKATLEKYNKQLPAENAKRIATLAITEDLDAGVGEIMRSVERLGLTENTFVIYTSDNGAGGGGRRQALRGGKGGLWEGGLRVPLIVRGPGVAANSWCHARVVGYDFFPTFCEWAGISADRLPRDLDGGSLVPVLAQAGHGEVLRPRDELIFHFPHYQSSEGPQSAIYSGDLKLIKYYEDNRLALFDLTQDLAERNNLADQRPQDAARLQQRLEAYLQAVNAQLPIPNPDYDPSAQQAPAREKRGGKKGKARKDSP